MTDNTIDLSRNYLLLQSDRAVLVVLLPGGGDFWSQSMSGDATDPGIRRLLDSEHGRLLSALPMGAEWTNWEMHPAVTKFCSCSMAKQRFFWSFQTA